MTLYLTAGTTTLNIGAGIVASSAASTIETVATEYLIVTPCRTNKVVSTAGDDRVVTGTSVNHITAVRAENCFTLTSACNCGSMP